ncbi:MAG: glycosyltransferase family 4 protein [Fimbriimonadaceae bacterium]
MNKQPYKIFWLGAPVPDRNDFHAPSLHRSGNLFAGNLIKGLQENGVSIDRFLSYRPVAAFPGDKKLTYTAEETEIPGLLKQKAVGFVNLKLAKQLTMGTNSYREVLRWARGLHPDTPKALVVYNLTAPPAPFVIKAARKVGAKCFAIVNDLEVPGKGRTPANAVRAWEYKSQIWGIRNFDGLEVCNENLAKQYAPGLPFVLVEGGVPFSMTERSYQPVPLSERDAVVLLYTGRLSEAHGVDMLLEAFKRLKGENLELRIAGAGPMEETVLQAAARDPRIKVLGYRPFDELLPHFARADIALSLWRMSQEAAENFFPGKLLDYMGCGAAVVSTAVGHVERDFSEHIFILKNETPESLTALLQTALDTPRETLYEFGIRCRDYAIETKSWPAQAKLLQNLIEQTLGVAGWNSGPAISTTGSGRPGALS